MRKKQECELLKIKDFLHVLWRRFQEPCSLFPSLFATVIPRTSVLWDWVWCCHKIFGGLSWNSNSCFPQGQETWTQHAQGVLDVPSVVWGLMLLWKLTLVYWKVLKQLQKYRRFCKGSFSPGTMSGQLLSRQSRWLQLHSDTNAGLRHPCSSAEEIKPGPTEGFSSYRHTERTPLRPKNFILYLEHLREWVYNG